MSNIRSRYIRRKPKGVTYMRGECGFPGCLETRLGTSGFCLKSHHSMFLKIVRAEAPLDKGNLHCKCELPQPSSDAFMVSLFNTVQCNRCGRAIFNDKGEQLNTISDVISHVEMRRFKEKYNEDKRK